MGYFGDREFNDVDFFKHILGLHEEEPNERQERPEGEFLTDGQDVRKAGEGSRGEGHQYNGVCAEDYNVLFCVRR